MKNLIEKICAVNFVIGKIKDLNDGTIESLGILKESLDTKNRVGENESYYKFKNTLQEGLVRMNNRSKMVSYLMRNAVITDEDDDVINNLMKAFADYIDKTTEELTNEYKKF